MSKTKTKRYLVLLAAVGLIAAGLGGSGTFASFNAEVSHTGNYFATGSLFLHATNNGTTCTSESVVSNLNNGTNGDTCTQLFSVTPSDGHAQYASLKLSNAGTVDAAGIKFALRNGCLNARLYNTNTTLAANYTAGATTLSVNATTLAIQNGGHIQISDGTNTELATVVGAVPISATTQTITIASGLTNSYLAGTPTAVRSSADFGTSALCAHLDFTITETNSTYSTTAQNDTGTTGALGCAYGTATGGTDGCVFDTAHNLNSSLTADTPLLLKSGGSTNTLFQLDHAKSRYFLIGIKPDTTAITNADQDTKATFDVTWRIDQA
jgi:predicted ribosomally synthesized peptide with SipW-like signal peptide